MPSIIKHRSVNVTTKGLIPDQFRRAIKLRWKTCRKSTGKAAENLRADEPVWPSQADDFPSVDLDRWARAPTPSATASDRSLLRDPRRHTSHHNVVCAVHEQPTPQRPTPIQRRGVRPQLINRPTRYWSSICPKKLGIAREHPKEKSCWRVFALLLSTSSTKLLKIDFLPTSSRIQMIINICSDPPANVDRTHIFAENHSRISV